MDIIRLLPVAVANQIAAGEVIQRPASAVKEMLENAVDAGSTEITLIVKDAGKTLIQVNDNGCGMSPADAALCFERHATSKIREANDLFAIRTMGFRGEALASIAAIAQVELKTRRVEDELGYCIQIEGSAIKSQEACQCQAGTSVMVRNLFFNVPARRNFLKAEALELSYIIEEFQRVALVNPTLSLSLFNNGKAIFQLKPGNTKQRILALFGQNYAQRLLDVETKTNLLNVKGFIGRPEHARKKRGEQYFFANGRFIRHSYLYRAVEQAYQDLLPEKSFPTFFLYLDVDPKTIDINIHPTKTEVKFEDEKSLYMILRAAVRQALGKYSLTPSLDFDREDVFDFPEAKSGEQIIIPKIEVNPDFNPFEKSQGSFSGTKARSGLDQWEKLYADLKKESDEGQQIIESTLDISGDDTSHPGFLQIHGRYLLTRMKSGLMMVDLNHARERIFYERIMRSLQNGRAAVQQQMFPLTVRFAAQDAGLLLSIMKEIRCSGFDIEDLGGGSFAVNGTPADMEDSNVQAVIESILEDYRNGTQNDQVEKSTRIAASMARQMASRARKNLGQDEMRSVVDLLFACETPDYTPNGKRTFYLMTTDELERKFNA